MFQYVVPTRTATYTLICSFRLSFNSCRKGTKNIWNNQIKT
nr:MAG TPA: hypothetical protein [Caudoviricetes sp.]